MIPSVLAGQMKKIILILTVVSFIFASNDYQAKSPLKEISSQNKILFDRAETKKLFLDNPFSGSQYDPVTRKVYGLLSSTGEWHFASIDIKTGKIRQLKPFPEVTKFARGVSAVDPKQRRYFFIGKVNESSYLYTLDISTSDVIYRYKLTRPFTFLAYHGQTDKLYGLSKTGGTYYFISFDIYSGKVAVVSKLPGHSRLKGTSRKIDSLEGVFLFEGVVNGRRSLLSIHLKQGGIKTVDAHRVGVDEYRVHVFGKNQPVNMLYSFGVGNCVVVAGYCKACGVGFLAHFSSRFEKMEETLGEIEKQIKKKGSKGFAEMNLYVAGGRIRNAASYENAIKVHRLLTETFAAGYKGDKIFHLGMVYNIIIDNGNIDIFF
jgi:hypothetical protein